MPESTLKQLSTGDWEYTDRYGDKVKIAPGTGGPAGNVFLDSGDGNHSIAITKKDVQAFVNAVLEVHNRPPNCTRCKGSGKEPHQ